MRSAILKYSSGRPTGYETLVTFDFSRGTGD
jgi:hypothetical protein